MFLGLDVTLFLADTKDCRICPATASFPVKPRHAVCRRLCPAVEPHTARVAAWCRPAGCSAAVGRPGRHQQQQFRVTCAGERETVRCLRWCICCRTCFGTEQANWPVDYSQHLLAVCLSRGPYSTQRHWHLQQLKQQDLSVNWLSFEPTALGLSEERTPWNDTRVLLLLATLVCRRSRTLLPVQ